MEVKIILLLVLVTCIICDIEGRKGGRGRGKKPGSSKKPGPGPDHKTPPGTDHKTPPGPDHKTPTGPRDGKHPQGKTDDKIKATGVFLENERRGEVDTGKRTNPRTTTPRIYTRANKSTTRRPTGYPTTRPTPRPTTPWTRPWTTPTPRPTTRPWTTPTPRPTTRTWTTPTPRPTTRPWTTPTPRPTGYSTTRPTVRTTPPSSTRIIHTTGTGSRRPVNDIYSPDYPPRREIGWKSSVLPDPSRPSITKQPGHLSGGSFNFNHIGGHHNTHYQPSAPPPPQQHFFAQPAQQPFVPSQTVIVLQEERRSWVSEMLTHALAYSMARYVTNSLFPSHNHYRPNNNQNGEVITNTVVVNHYFNGTENNSSSQTNNTVRTNPNLGPGSAQNSSNQGTPQESFHYRISDNALKKISEELFLNDESLFKYVSLDLQRKSSENITDVAARPLLYVRPQVFEFPTVNAIHSLYDNYEFNVTKQENITQEEIKEQNFLLDVLLHTNVMAIAMRWLAENNYISFDDFGKKDVLKSLWFTPIGGTTSAFERTFTSEMCGDGVTGVTDWLYFNYKESMRQINYLGYIDKLDFDDKVSLVKLNFEENNVIRPAATIFVGTSPELEMALYTICYFTRPNNICPLSFNGKEFFIYTHIFQTTAGINVLDIAMSMFYDQRRP